MKNSPALGQDALMTRKKTVRTRSYKRRKPGGTYRVVKVKASKRKSPKK